MNLLTIKQVAALTGLSTRTVRRHADAGTMPRAIRIGASKRWRLAALEKFIAAKAIEADDTGAVANGILEEVVHG